MRKKVPNNTIERLPLYLRVLNDLDAQNVERIASPRIAEITGRTASQIRQDLSLFGSFGQQGYGYTVQNLRDVLADILGANQAYKVILIGAGHLGTAIMENFNFIAQNYIFQGAFDIDPKKIGTTIGGWPVYDGRSASSFIKDNQTDIAILTVPREHAQTIADAMSDDGIRAIWNFTGVDLHCSALVENILFSDSLLKLTYKLHERDK